MKSKYFVIIGARFKNVDLLDFIAKEILIYEDLILLVTNVRYDLSRVKNVINDLYGTYDIKAGKNVYRAYLKRYFK